MNRTKTLVELSRRIDEHLSQFAEIDLKGDGSSIGCCGDYASRGPSLSVYGRKDSKVYDLPKKGEARVKYRVRSKGVDYRGDDGEESYRTEIEIESIEPVNLEAVVEKYGFKRGYEDKNDYGVSVDGNLIARAKKQKGAVSHVKRNAATYGGAGVGGVVGGVLGASSGLPVMLPVGALMGAKVGRLVDEHRHNKTVRENHQKTEEAAKKKTDLSDILSRYDFDRARDSGGRFAPGQNVSADDMADAYVNPEKKKKAALLAGAGVAGVTAAAVGAKNPAVAQGVGRLLRRI